MIPVSINVTEGDGNVQVCITLSGVLSNEGDVEVALTTNSDTGNFLECDLTTVYNTAFFTAMGNSDYVDIYLLVQFMGYTNGSTKCENVTILDDAALESDEVFTVTLTSNPGVLLDNTKVTITIMDDNDGQWLVAYNQHQVLFYVF